MAISGQVKGGVQMPCPGERAAICASRDIWEIDDTPGLKDGLGWKKAAYHFLGDVIYFIALKNDWNQMHLLNYLEAFNFLEFLCNSSDNQC